MSTSRMKRKKKTARTKSINAPLRVIKGCCVESSDIDIQDVAGLK